MPAVTRLGDTCTGHGCFPPRESVGASGDVFANSIAVHRLTDPWAAHGCPVCPPHGSELSSGSGTVFVNSLAMGRIADNIACGSKVAVGSGNVFAGRPA